MKKPYLMMILTLLLVQTSCLKTNINNNWQLTIDKCARSAAIQGKTYNVTIPSTLHLDLLKQKQISDPFFGNNYPSLHWVSQCQVTYSTNISFAGEIYQHQHIQIVFEGIDTYATVMLNKKYILTTKNAFVEYRIQINKQDIIHDQINTLQVKIKPTNTFQTPADRSNKMPFIYAHTRKPCYQYSWDWAPYLNTMGIWKSVYLNSYNQIKINYVWARNKVISQSEATINFAISLNVPMQQGSISNYIISINDQNGHLAQVEVKDSHVYVDLTISNPKLWWPNGIGQPYIYDFLVKLKKNSVVIDDRKIPFGIRTAKLQQKNNQFTVILNGYQIYCKGANYVPPDMFYPRLTNPDFTPGNTIQNLINDAVQSNFNMIRLWGGGQYQSDKFLQLASRKGIMIFYDFMFSDSIYPSDESFLINVQQQIKQQIRRVRNYPCLVLWSGNNQILQGIFSWGWGRDNYRNDYHKLFQWLIVEVLKKQNPQIPYIPSSPVNGVGNGGFNKGGDIHFWGVWAGGSGFQAYKTALGPFNSQFGTQSLPVWQTIKQFTQPSQRSYQSQAFAAHQRHGSKFRMLQKYHQLYAHASKNFQMQAYMSGLVQAFGIQIAIAYQRCAKPKSYGTLYWQFNDAWPAISWSSIDYYGRWKPLQFMAKRLYPNVAIFCLDGVVKAINDNLYPVDAVAIIKVVSFNGQVILSKQHQIRLQINEVKKVMDIDLSGFQQRKSQLVVHMQIISGRKQEMVSTYFYRPFKQLQLPKAKLFVTYDQQYNLIKVSTDKFIKNLFISNTEEYVKLSDNYFDLIANRQVKVTLLPTKLNEQVNLSKLKSTMKYRGYRQIHQDQQLQVVVVNG